VLDAVVENPAMDEPKDLNQRFANALREPYRIPDVQEQLDTVLSQLIMEVAIDRTAPPGEWEHLSDALTDMIREQIVVHVEKWPLDDELRHQHHHEHTH
jgi:hypothetical protein